MRDAPKTQRERQRQFSHHGGPGRRRVTGCQGGDAGERGEWEDGMKTDLAEFFSISNFVEYAGQQRQGGLALASEQDEEEEQGLVEWRRTR